MWFFEGLDTSAAHLSFRMVGWTCETCRREI